MEIERKYLHPDMVLLRGKLSRSGAVFQGRFWEDNLVLDTPEGTLLANRELLRLRDAGVVTLTFKRMPRTAVTQAPGIKILEELETAVADKAAMLGILEHLGYRVAFRYEKLRETWKWQGCTICLDTLPFMKAVELEGEPARIDSAAIRFGLDSLEASTMTYHQLHDVQRRALGLPPVRGFVFTDAQKAALDADENPPGGGASPTSSHGRPPGKA